MVIVVFGSLFFVFVAAQCNVYRYQARAYASGGLVDNVLVL
jgi:hypothetical protein